ncbi:hypothetical protein C7H19_09400 [Aphanothece hegewaldii CCALA 016]|uniref:DUF2157 domain-containing protein n=1 Tax=Aphanothece hegewaldii CCALA 016 TaxID=2107694 RepID=A0A2T1LZC0_9CHRO|nr:hypothetical protein [Aphanothece hegewaldii]PSF37752.1 hypothetical protein C7H19_09400 [Aphanothece hegewaldii CCALA 016]
MNPEPPSKKIYLQIPIDAANPLLLDGLETWLRFGLISEQQVKNICQQYLVCSLPEVPILSPADSLPVSHSLETRLIPSRINISPIQSFFSQFFTSFREELSLRWLLFLGLFLVIVSSGVLAATQWQKFSPIGQYLILWSYTLVFWVIGFWSKRQENLLLTSQTLQTIALFLIPINFWAMDTFKLWTQNLGIVLIVVATLSLLAIYFYSRLSQLNLVGQINYLGLNLLHWGWQNAVFPISAIYLGSFLTAIDLTFFQNFSRQEANEREKASFSKTLLLYGLAILLVRGIFFLKLSLVSLGLAIGICGWLLRQKSEEEVTILDKVLDIVGLILLFFGWGVAVYHNAIWQALAITGLSLHYFWEKLRTNWRLSELFALFIIGFQSLFLLEDIIPIDIRQSVSNAWIKYSQTSDYSLSIYSLTFFPYIILWVWFTGWLYREGKPRLANFGEWLTLGLGICLTSLSLETNAGRSLNLLLSTSTLVYLVSFRPIRVYLIYFTHGIGLLTFISWIDWIFPSLNLTQWGYFLILLTAGEWLNSLRYKPLYYRNKKQWWYLSSWHFGFILAISSLIIFISLLNIYFATGSQQTSILAWLLVPSFLTILASFTRKKRSRQAALLSSYGFVFAQLLTLWQPSIRLISLGISAVVILINSFYYKHPHIARLAIQFIFIFGSNWILEKWLSSSQLIDILFLPQWSLFNGIYILLLWLVRNRIKNKNNRLASIYSLALEQVASVLCISEIIRLSFHAYFVTSQELNTDWQWIFTAILIIFSLIYRYWQSPKEIAVYGLFLSIEILVIESILGLNGTKLVISLVNLVLASITLVATDWLFARFPNLSRLKSLQISPLLLAVMVIIWRFGEFTAYTGLLTLGVAIIGLFVSSRFPQNKTLIYLSLFGITLGCHEIIIYQLWKNINYLLVNELILLSLVQVSLAYVYRLIIWTQRNREFVLLRHITLETLEKIADLNWGLAIPFKILGLLIAVFLVPHFYPNLILFVLTLTVPSYALLKARHSTTKNRWIYLGFIDIYLTAIFARWIWQQLEILDPYFALIAAVFAIIIYHIPWQQWGWNLKPWRYIAYSLSLITTVLTFTEISNLSLFSVAAFYIYLAVEQRKIRWSYISVIILNWLLFRFFEQQNLREIIYYATVIGISILYLAQVDPKLQESSNRKIRHYLRIIGSSIINVTALVFYQKTGLTPSIISLLTVLAGLGLKIRAFLLVGTITFILTVFYQLVILSFQYTLLKWIIGLVVGILLITVAANFERRREQMLSLVRLSLEQLNRWE